ncbi:MAG: MBL fold metallo-hydrolase [Candidatus Thorarchaeota archaeon]
MDNYIKYKWKGFAMVLEEVAGKVYADTSGENGGNFGAIVLDDQIVMVDSGMIHTKSHQTREQLEDEHNLRTERILLTHYHADHLFGAQAFEPVRVISSVATRDICVRNLEGSWERDTLLESYSPVQEDRPELWDALQDLRILVPEEVFDRKLTLGDKGEIVAFHMGGHTAGSSIVVVEPEHVVFVGDLIFNKSFPYAGDPTCHPDEWIIALEDIIKSDFREVIPGHGPMCEKSDVANELDFLKSLRKSVKDALVRGVSADKYLELEMYPEHHLEGRENRLPSAVDHWFAFYGK